MALTIPYPFNEATNPPIEIDPGTTATANIIISKVVASTAVPIQLIRKGNISDITYVYYGSNSDRRYPWPTETRLVITMNDGQDHTFELQSVANQPSWNDGTETACIAAITDINAAIPV